MNKCLANRRSNTAVALRKGVKRRNGSRIAQHYGDLPALGAQRGLTLCAGLGLGHGSMFRGEEIAALLGMRFLGRLLVKPERLSALINPNPLPGGSVGYELGNGRREVTRHFVSGTAVHVHLPGGPIPPMSESYAVTSDVSTPSNKYFWRAS